LFISLCCSDTQRIFRVYRSGRSKEKTASIASEADVTPNGKAPSSFPFITNTTETKASIVFFHGAGHSALSWALCAHQIRLESKCEVIAFDSRGHGATRTSDDTNMSLETFVNDAIDLISTLFNDFSSGRKIILVGHSMGGSIAAHVAKRLSQPDSPVKNLVGLVVVDVVEGTALSALSSMHRIIQNRPTFFTSIAEAIQWSLFSGMLRNVESAQVSVPSLLLKNNDGYIWRTNLLSTEPFWQEWFNDLSNVFLSARVAKMLILAGTDRLDKPLTIAQMQGKFHLVLFPTCGHAIQEDDPLKTARAIIQFQQRNRW